MLGCLSSSFPGFTSPPSDPEMLAPRHVPRQERRKMIVRLLIESILSLFGFLLEDLAFFIVSAKNKMIYNIKNTQMLCHKNHWAFYVAHYVMYVQTVVTTLIGFESSCFNKLWWIESLVFMNLLQANIAKIYIAQNNFWLPKRRNFYCFTVSFLKSSSW